VEKLANGGLVLADHPGDVRIIEVEDLAQQEHRAFGRRQPLEQHQEGDRDALRVALALLGGEERLGQPGPDVLLAPHARRLQVIEA
jgi:hypothetical protein